MSMPQLQFVKVDGVVGIVVHSAAALAWVMRSPPPASVPIWLAKGVLEELKREAEATKG